MAEGTTTDLRVSWRLPWLVLPLCILAALLAACSGQVQPFSKATKPGGRTPPAIIVRAIAGLPADKEKVLFESLAAAAGPRDIAIVRDDFKGGYSLTGEFRAEQGPEGVVLAYRWVLIDDKGRTLHEIADSEAGRPVTGDPWGGIDPDTLRRVATYTAESLSSRLSQLGFATQSAGLLPPADTFAEAGPGAEKDIDPTLYGTLAAAVMAPQPAAAPVERPELMQDLEEVSVDPAEPVRREARKSEVSPKDPASRKADLVTMVVASGGKGDREDRTERAESAQETERADSAERAEEEVTRQSAEKEDGTETREAEGKREINAVAVTKVRGAPGEGNAELAVAMRQTLGNAGWPVLARSRPDALTVEGAVRVTKPVGKQQRVELSWTVKMPDGMVLGSVSQANTVEAGSLDKGWGDAAHYAAQGAAQGIFDLVAKARTRS